VKAGNLPTGIVIELPVYDEDHKLTGHLDLLVQEVNQDI